MVFRNIIRGGYLLSALFLVSICFDATAQEYAREENDILIVSEQEQAMNDAIATAQATAYVFWDLLQQYPDYPDAFTVKAGLPTTAGGVEHIWVGEVSLNGNTISGALVNEPFELVGDLTLGDPVTFTTDDLSDWAVYSDGKQYGAFTTRVIADLIGGEDGAALRQTLHDAPLPEMEEAE